MFQRVGPVAFKKDLTNTIKLLGHLGNPHNSFKSIHIAGTNGKGSTASIIASVLSSSGFSTGLYTSPHLRSFTERIRVDGKEIPELSVTRFVEENMNFLKKLKPSFFEMTVAMAFDHFRNEEVDFAVVEVGLGGRLDSTNVINPEICLITNIGMDHMEFLGETIKEIAWEKAGIIKKGAPLVVSEYHEDSFEVFSEKCLQQETKLIKAWEFGKKESTLIEELGFKFKLHGDHQKKNLTGAICLLHELIQAGVKISVKDMKRGLKDLEINSGLRGRWYQLGSKPDIFCDCAHNQEALESIQPMIGGLKGTLHVVWGSVSDKDVKKNLLMMPETASYYYCAPDVPRKMNADELRLVGESTGRKGSSYGSVLNALEAAKEKAGKQDSIFIGGSTFVVAEVV